MNDLDLKPTFVRLLSLCSLRITADKRLRYASPKLPSATSFIHKTLGKYCFLILRKKDYGRNIFSSPRLSN